MAMASGNETVPTTGTDTAPEQTKTYPSTRVQTDWYKRNRKTPITVRLVDGTQLSGTLQDWDTYTIALQVRVREEPVLINKQAVALFMRREVKDEEKKG